MAPWPPRPGQLGRGPRATFPLWGVSMAPGAALGKKTEALRNSSPGDAHVRAHPELCGSSPTWIWVNLPFFAQLRRCLWPAGAARPETGTCQRWGGMDGASGRLKAKNCAVRVPLQGHGERGSSLGKHWHGWTLPKPSLSPAAPSTTGGLKVNPGYIFF